VKRLASIVAILVLAASAQAQTTGIPHKTKLVVPPKPLALRGPQSPVPAIKPAPAPPLSSWASSAYGAPPSDPGECRTGCAHSYYFCLAGEDASSCPQSWTSCQSACAEPAIASR
jgi:hypothetical protein